MNILILNWRDVKHPLAGGAEVMLLEHAKAWHKNKATITWFSSKSSKIASQEKIEGIEYIRKGSHYTVILWAFIYYLQGKLGKPDIVIDCFHFLPFFTPLYIRRKRIIAVIHEVAGKVWFQNLFYPLALIGYYIEPLIIRIYKRKTFITVSKSTKKELENIGIQTSKIHVIENGVAPVKNIHGKRNMKYLLFLGRLSKDKGIEDALEAFKLLHEEFSDLRLIIAGKGESSQYNKKIKRLAKELSIVKNVNFLGYVDDKEKYKLLAQSGLLLHPSEKEGWGLTVIEANSVGTPVVGYDVEGLRDSIIDGKTGILVDQNPESLAQGARMLLMDKEFYTHCSREAKEWSKNFTWEKSTKKSVEIIR